MHDHFFQTNLKHNFWPSAKSYPKQVFRRISRGKKSTFFKFWTNKPTIIMKIVGIKKAKKINSMSQSLWQIGRPDLNEFFLNIFFFLSLSLSLFSFFFFFSWAADMSDMSRSQLCSVWNMELDFWVNKIQDRKQSWRSLLFKVFYCVCHIFSCILTSS